MMNFDKVLDLYEQSEEFADNHPTAQYEARIYDQVRMMKFAELIIKDCIRVVQAESENSGDQWEDGLIFAENAIKRHFGVK